MKLLFSRKFICVKKQDFYIKRQLSYKNIFCKKTAFFQSRFLQKYIFVKKLLFYLVKTTIQFVNKKLFYIKMTLFYKNRFLCNIYIFELTITELGRVAYAASSHTVDRPFSPLLLFSKLALALQTMTSAKNLKTIS